MASIASDPADVIVGVDTHKDQHVALGERFVSAAPAGYADLLAWAAGLGRVAAFGVEGTGSYGLGLARFLRRHGIVVLEVARPPRKGQRRRQGKSDPVDAEHAARELLAGASAVTPKTAEGAVEAIRLLKVARDTAVTAHSQAMITLKATLVTANDTLRAELEPRPDFALVTACAALEVSGDLADPEVAMRHALRALACRWLALHEEIKVHTRHSSASPPGPPPSWWPPSGSASTVPPSCSVPPATTPVGSVLSCRRQAVRRLPHPGLLRQDQPSPPQPGRQPPGQRRAVPDRRRPDALASCDHRLCGTPHPEGLSKREIIRCLKRYVAREVYRLLPSPRPPSHSRPHRST
jgi:transposase